MVSRLPNSHNGSFVKMNVKNDSFIRSINVVSFQIVKEKVTYKVVARGRTRFLHQGTKNHNDITFEKDVKFNELNRLSHIIVSELKHAFTEPLSVSNNQNHNNSKFELPSFPSQKFWFSKIEKTAKKRMELLNEYFNTLFQRYREQIMYSPNLMDFFSPEILNIYILGSCYYEQEQFLQALVQRIAMGFTNNGQEIEEQFSNGNGRFFEAREAQEYLSPNALLEFPNTLQFSDILLRNESEVEIELKPQTFIDVPKPKNKFKPSTPTKKFDHSHFMPFDYICQNSVYRIDIENYDIHKDKTPASTLCNLCFQSTPLFILAFDLTRRESLGWVREMLLQLKLFLKDDSLQIPPFILVGLSQEDQMNSVICNEEIFAMLNSFYGQNSPFHYLDASHKTGHNLLHVLNKLIETYKEVMKKKQH